MFRDEASALIALPQHPNLARFVTFDAGSKPKPILVMEFVEGADARAAARDARSGHDAGAASRSTTCSRAWRRCTRWTSRTWTSSPPTWCCARAGRRCSSTSGSRAGTCVPGCATGPYGAPEVWGAEALEGLRRQTSPAKADIYAFGCVAFETADRARALRCAERDGAGRDAHHARRVRRRCSRSSRASRRSRPSPSCSSRRCAATRRTG